MPNYNLNKNAQSNGDHEVHEDGCSHGPLRANQIILGFHAGCLAAVKEAKRRYPGSRINGCYYCSTTCHTS